MAAGPRERLSTAVDAAYIAGLASARGAGSPLHHLRRQDRSHPPIHPPVLASTAIREDGMASISLIGMFKIDGKAVSAVCVVEFNAEWMKLNPGDLSVPRGNIPEFFLEMIYADISGQTTWRQYYPVGEQSDGKEGEGKDEQARQDRR